MFVEEKMEVKFYKHCHPEKMLSTTLFFLSNRVAKGPGLKMAQKN